MKKKSILFKIFVIIMPIISIALIYSAVKLYKQYIYSIEFPCIFNLFTGYFCPGCGNTRSIIALLNGHIILSLRYNPFIILLFVFLILLYIELFTSTFYVHKKIIPRSNKFLFVTLGIMIIYYFIRNFIPILMIP
ncbi:MAG TPA: DUF2752 domain-containing protein [Clostridiales bacterium]|nr:DUF2752 domain-containing protein [Clostridiales bacterium]